MDRITALRELLAQNIGNMEFNIKQYEDGGKGNWMWPGTYEEAKGRLQGYREIHHLIRN